MDSQQFKRILTTFADCPTNIDVGKGEFAVQVVDEIITGRIVTKEGDLWVHPSEGQPMRAATWIVQRIARLPLLASRIVDYVDPAKDFVVPHGKLLDQLEHAPGEEETDFEGTSKILEMLGRRPAGTQSILYLTSDAGEGKTTLINKLAVEQARRYKSKESDWLLLPIELGGRPILRLDDVIVASLLNRFRFPLLYYDAFVELVRMGVIVPALDGFEEMFVEGESGGAISSLGNLLTTLNDSGTVLIAARKAYFEYRRLETQAHLIDSIRSGAVAFARVALCRWSRSQFLDYCKMRGVSNGEGVYSRVATILRADHPLLTRAVLVRRLIDLAENPTQLESLCSKLKAAPGRFFAVFVESLLKREVAEKWVDISGHPAMPLLTTGEHEVLLSSLALEMWRARTEVVAVEIADIVAQLFCDSNRKDASTTHQVMERFKSHAFIVTRDQGGKRISFDHEEFYHFFLGLALGVALDHGDIPELKDICRQGALPALTVQTAVARFKERKKSVIDLVQSLESVGKSEVGASYLAENSGSLIMGLLSGESTSIQVRGIVIPRDGLVGRSLHNVEFINCDFRPTRLNETRIEACRFVTCQFDGIEIGDELKIRDAGVQDGKIAYVLPPGQTGAIYDPERSWALLAGVGFARFKGGARAAVPSIVSSADERLAIVHKAVRAFTRSTQVNEQTLQTNLGSSAGQFFREILPELLKSGILDEMQYVGQGRQRRFKLMIRYHKIAVMLRECHGNFDEFINLARK